MTTKSLTIFKNIFDNKTGKTMNFESFDDFETLLYKLSKEKYATKNDAYLISPAVYTPNTTRRNVNVVSWAGWAALDVDEMEIVGDVETFIRKKFDGIRYVCYSTASSSRTHPKFRLVFDFSSHIDVSDIRNLWYALNTWAGELGDRQVKDFSRMYYVPGTYQNSYNFIFSGHGNSLSASELIAKYPAPEKPNNFFDGLPEEIQAQIIEHRKAKLTNNSYTWNGYRDCPFWPKSLEHEYRAITGSGWYYALYRIMVAIAGNAISKEYPITPMEIAQLCREFDAETGGWYKDRPLETEAERALDFVYRNPKI